MVDRLNLQERVKLLEIAREAINSAVMNEPLETLDLAKMSLVMRGPGASFVTLTIEERLRGCIGALEAYQPLALDVQEHAAAAAMEDFRFPPLSREELPLIEIEISRLTPMKSLDYTGPQDLLAKLRPGVDGVVLKDEIRKATFLPQVWEKVSSKEEFLDHLCLKMGARPSLWREKHLEVMSYQVEEFKEIKSE
jgi:AmmeMemoRadiSam system protein A